MNRELTIEQIQVALSQVLGREIENLGPDVRLVEDLSLDSTSVIELLMALEDLIGLEVDVDELEPTVFQSVGSLADYCAAGVQDAVA